MDVISVALAIALTAAVLLLWLVFSMWRKALSDLKASRFSSKSLSSKYGKLLSSSCPSFPITRRTRSGSDLSARR